MAEKVKELLHSELMAVGVNKSVHITRVEPPICWTEAANQIPRRKLQKMPTSVYRHVIDMNPSKNPRTETAQTPKRSKEETDREVVRSPYNPIQQLNLKHKRWYNNCTIQRQDKANTR